MKRIISETRWWQLKLYQLWCHFHRICFGLNDPHDSLPNHNGHLKVGNHCHFSGDVKFIQCNHDINNPDIILPYEDIIIGDYVWIGANVVILPGVILGNHMTVAAGAVVTKSFPEGHIVLAGIPAKILKKVSGIKSPMQQV